MYEKNDINDEQKKVLGHDLDILISQVVEYYDIKELNEIPKKDIKKIPKIDELTYEGINDTIRFANNQLLVKSTEKIIKYTLKDIIKAIELCSEKIIEEIGEV